MKRLASVCKLIEAINDWSGKLAIYLIFPLIGLMAADVGARYFFNASIYWAHHTSLFIYAAFTLLAGGYCLRHRAHVRVDIIYRRFSRRTQAILDVITAGFFFLFAVALLREGWLAFVLSWQLQETVIGYWRAILWPVKLVVPIAGALLLLQGMVKFSRDLSYAVSGRELL